MKTKFTLLFVFSLFFLSSSFAQNTSQNPDSLNVEFNDTTQNLQVNGSMIVDSSLTVKDSVIMEDNLHIYEKLQLEKDAHLKKDVYVGNEIKVEGDVYLMKNVYVNENLKVNGETHLINIASFYNKINFLNLNSVDPASYSNTEDSTNQNLTPNILFLDQNGEVQKGEGDILKSLIYQPLPPSFNCINPITGAVPNPTWANGPSKIYVACPDDARVGIGTNSPKAKLDVRGTTYTTKLAIGGMNPDDMIGRFHLKTGFLEANNSTVFLIENDDRKIFQISNNGLLNVREVKVDLEAWPDYVFEENYKLRPLVEVENFIKLNGHLPNIPNAKTIESEGVNLGEMNKLLMEKVEELTLYLIEQNKQLQIQNTRIESLEKTIENSGK